MASRARLRTFYMRAPVPIRLVGRRDSSPGRGDATWRIPIAPRPFRQSGKLDPGGMRRVLDCMIDQKVDGICILSNYSEQFLLTDEERDTLLALRSEERRVGKE